MKRNKVLNYPWYVWSFIGIGLGVAVLATFCKISVELGTMWILLLTLIAVILYFYETKRIADWGPMQFRLYWISEVFRYTLNKRIDDCISALKSDKREGLDASIRKEINSQLSFLAELWPDPSAGKKIGEEKRDEFEKKWEAVDEKYTEKNRCELSSYLYELKNWLQTELGKLAKLPDP